jgi:hypothetical protein
MCGHEHHHGKADSCGCGCGFNRRFFSKQEKIAKMESYLKELKAETEAVEAKLACLKEEK